MRPSCRPEPVSAAPGGPPGAAGRAHRRAGGRRAARLAAAVFALGGSGVQAGELTLSSGFEYTSGKYGDRDASTSWYVPFVARYEHGLATLKLTVPYLRNTGAVSRTPDGVAIPGSGGTQEGWGDVVASAGMALLSRGDLSVDGVAKLKLPTADPDKGLGTGKADWSLQADAYWRSGALTTLLILGWKKYGDPDGVDFRNPLFASLGLSWRLSATTSLGVFHDWRERLTQRGAEISEATFYLSWKPAPDWKLQVYAVRGFSDASPDLGVGTLLSRTF